MSFDLEMEEIVKVFFEESFEGLDAMESGLLTLDVHADRETINTIFRAAHSIKGGAGTFGFMEIAQFTHSVETLLDEMRNGMRAVSNDAVQVLLQAVDVIREMTQSAQAKQPIVTVGADALSGELARILAQKGDRSTEAAPPAKALCSRFRLHPMQLSSRRATIRCASSVSSRIWDLWKSHPTSSACPPSTAWIPRSAICPGR